MDNLTDVNQGFAVSHWVCDQLVNDHAAVPLARVFVFFPAGRGIHSLESSLSNQVDWLSTSCMSPFS